MKHFQYIFWRQLWMVQVWRIKLQIDLNYDSGLYWSNGGDPPVYYKLTPPKWWSAYFLGYDPISYQFIPHCVTNGGMYISNQPQYFCSKCKNFWSAQARAPICSGEMN